MVKNLKDLFKKFNTEEKCREFLIQQRWGGVPVCPYCGCNKSYKIEKGKRFKCANSECYKKYSVTLGTVMHASNIPLTTWLPATYIISAHKKGISSVQLAKDLGVTQKTSWFMLHRIRKSLQENHPEMLSGIIESDETYMGRKFRSEYQGLSEAEIDHIQQNKYSRRSKGAVIGIASRETGKIRVKSFDENKTPNIVNAIRENVQPGSELHTDESKLYNTLNKDYVRKTIFHTGKEWVNGNIYTNHVENFWSVMKRGVYGIYHQISVKHLQQYCNEFAYRYNSRDITDGERFMSVCTNLEGRLSYKQLVHGKGKENNPEETNQKGE